MAEEGRDHAGLLLRSVALVNIVLDEAGLVGALRCEPILKRGRRGHCEEMP
jgi:hypothetical protein